MNRPVRRSLPPGEPIPFGDAAPGHDADRLLDVGGRRPGPGEHLDPAQHGRRRQIPELDRERRAVRTRADRHVAGRGVSRRGRGVGRPPRRLLPVDQQRGGEVSLVLQEPGDRRTDDPQVMRIECRGLAAAPCRRFHRGRQTAGVDPADAAPPPLDVGCLRHGPGRGTRRLEPAVQALSQLVREPADFDGAGRLPRPLDHVDHDPLAVAVAFDAPVARASANPCRCRTSVALEPTAERKNFRLASGLLRRRSSSSATSHGRAGRARAGSGHAPSTGRRVRACPSSRRRPHPDRLRSRRASRPPRTGGRLPKPSLVHACSCGPGQWGDGWAEAGGRIPAGQPVWNAKRAAVARRQGPPRPQGFACRRRPTLAGEAMGKGLTACG